MLAPRLGLPLLDKDDILGALVDPMGVPDPQQRYPRSWTADRVLQIVAEQTAGAVLSSCWRREPGPARLILASVSEGLSSRLAAIVDALPFTSQSRVLEIGCGPGAAARAIARRLDTGHIVAIDRSAKAVAQAQSGSVDEIASGRMTVRHVAVESFVLEPGDEPFDIVFAVRVGALDGRHPVTGRKAMERIKAALAPGGRLFVDGGDPLRELNVTA